ncbi:unnamed protein product [Ixodes hexagonus]
MACCVFCVADEAKPVNRGHREEAAGRHRLRRPLASRHRLSKEGIDCPQLGLPPPRKE